MYEVGGSGPVGGSDGSAGGAFLLNFSKGGFQGGEGVTGGEAWYIENVIEELDTGREWFFDPTTSVLYYAPNVTATADPPPAVGFVATSLDVMINVTGSQAEPAKGIAIRGLTLRDASVTYLAPHGLPSGGDWALQKQGAITLVGTEGVSISGNLLTELDGNAVFIGGYHRALTIEANEFYGIGDSVLAAWGDTSECLNENCSLTLPKGVKMGPDGRGGDQPRGTRVIGNLAREIGLWQAHVLVCVQTHEHAHAHAYVQVLMLGVCVCGLAASACRLARGRSKALCGSKPSRRAPRSRGTSSSMGLAQHSISSARISIELPLPQATWLSLAV